MKEKNTNGESQICAMYCFVLLRSKQSKIIQRKQRTEILDYAGSRFNVHQAKNKETTRQ